MDEKYIYKWNKKRIIDNVIVKRKMCNNNQKVNSKLW